VKIWNTRVRVLQLVGAVRELGEYGPAKPLTEQGLDEVKEQYEGIIPDKGPDYKPDPSGRRTGNGVGAQLREVFERVCVDAELTVDAAQRRAVTTQEMLDEKIDNIRGAVTM
ncbi:unnamed protein product, partial [Phaeothamnion confervicola]